MNSSRDGIRSASEVTGSPAPTPRPSGRSGRALVEHLAPAECWRLIEAESFGRLAVEGLDGVPDVFPLNYTVHAGSIYIRSAPGAKVMAIEARPVAAFEIDGEQDGIHWSVVLRGAARRLALDKEIRESGVESLISLSPTAKYHYICLTPSSVSGRRFAANSRDASPGESPSARARRTAPHEPAQANGGSLELPSPAQLRRQRPVPIAHFPPR